MMEKLDVTFPSTVSEYDNCICGCCHDTGKVLKLLMPETLYFDGEPLSTKYRNLWICRSCARKLMDALGKIAGGD